MVPAAVWQAVENSAAYVADTLQQEGFIHCTGEPERLVWVANHFYRQIAGDFVILVIDPSALQAELRWEEADGHLFPHVYGPINRDAVKEVQPFPRNEQGFFVDWSTL